MFATHRYFHPVVSRPQHNDYIELDHLTKIVGNIVQAELAASH